MDTQQLANVVLYMAIVLTFSAAVLMAIAYRMFRSESAAKAKIERRLEEIIDISCPWNISGYHFRPHNEGAYEVRPDWFKGPAFLAWYDGQYWSDYSTRKRLLSQSFQWRRIPAIDERI